MPDIVTSKTFVDGEKGITAAKLNQIISGAVIQPAFYSAKPSSATLDPTDVLLELKGTGAFAQITGTQLASSVAGQLPLADATQNGMLRQLSGNTTDVVDGTNHCVPIASMAGITQMRLRSFNALGNSNFEVCQRNVGTLVTNPANNSLVEDRWVVSKGTSTLGYSAQRVGSGTVPILLPGTNFPISTSYFRITLLTQQTTMGAGDHWRVYQYVEGPQWRELSSDVHSVQLLVRSSIGGLSFGLTLQSPDATRSLTKLCTIPSANVWTLITLPNLPVWSGGNFNMSPGNPGYTFVITLAAGATLTTPGNDVWQNGNFLGAIGQSNFAASPINSTIDFAYAGHEPGAICTTPLDLSFKDNLLQCQRYFDKSQDYGIKPGTAGPFNVRWSLPGTQNPSVMTFLFKQRMAKAPTISAWATSSLTANAIRDETAAVDRAISSTIGVGESGFNGWNLSAVNAGQWTGSAYFAADTGW
jgi:hypothetical protein